MKANSKAYSAQYGTNPVLRARWVGGGARAQLLREEDLHLKHMEKKIKSAKSSIPPGGRGGTISVKRTPTQPPSGKNPQAELDRLIQDRLTDILGQPLIQRIQSLVRNQADGAAVAGAGRNSDGGTAAAGPPPGSPYAAERARQRPQSMRAGGRGRGSKAAPASARPAARRPVWTDDFATEREPVTAGERGPPSCPPSPSQAAQQQQQQQQRHIADAYSSPARPSGGGGGGGGGAAAARSSGGASAARMLLPGSRAGAPPFSSAARYSASAAPGGGVGAASHAHGAPRGDALTCSDAAMVALLNSPQRAGGAGGGAGALSSPLRAPSGAAAPRGSPTGGGVEPAMLSLSRLSCSDGDSSGGIAAAYRPLSGLAPPLAPPHLRRPSQHEGDVPGSSASASGGALHALREEPSEGLPYSDDAASSDGNGGGDDDDDYDDDFEELDDDTVAALDGGACAGRGAGGFYGGGGGGSLVRASLNESMHRSVGRPAAAAAGDDGGGGGGGGGAVRDDVRSLRASVSQLNTLVSIKIRSLIGGDGGGGAHAPHAEASGFSMCMDDEFARAARAAAAQSQDLGGSLAGDEDDYDAWADEDGAMLAHSQALLAHSAALLGGGSYDSGSGALVMPGDNFLQAGAGAGLLRQSDLDYLDRLPDDRALGGGVSDSAAWQDDVELEVAAPVGATSMWGGGWSAQQQQQRHRVGAFETSGGGCDGAGMSDTAARLTQLKARRAAQQVGRRGGGQYDEARAGGASGSGSSEGAAGEQPAVQLGREAAAHHDNAGMQQQQQVQWPRASGGGARDPAHGPEPADPLARSLAAETKQLFGSLNLLHKLMASPRGRDMVSPRPSPVASPAMSPLGRGAPPGTAPGERRLSGLGLESPEGTPAAAWGGGFGAPRTSDGDVGGLESPGATVTLATIGATIGVDAGCGPASGDDAGVWEFQGAGEARCGGGNDDFSAGTASSSGCGAASAPLPAGLTPRNQLCAADVEWMASLMNQVSSSIQGIEEFRHAATSS
ncbi:hypothetical protein FOA52_014243 [Chlamydomonas sp. UWO 241]|nr:hypothetical protein FOA52_014243 [Chlamydomonas sp. UWO 241]